jgi:hypothetical protein
MNGSFDTLDLSTFAGADTPPPPASRERTIVSDIEAHPLLSLGIAVGTGWLLWKVSQGEVGRMGARV